MTKLGYLALGVDEVQRLSDEQNLDLDLTMTEIIGIGRSVYDQYRAQGHAPHLTPAGLAGLNRLVAERERPFRMVEMDQVQGQDHGTEMDKVPERRPSPANYHARRNGHSLSARQDTAQVSSSASASIWRYSDIRHESDTGEEWA